ncbi:MAG: DNA replication/repair protein RecF [bacterium]
MFLKHLELVNFRNYKMASIDFKAQKTILIGENAQGKTNLLESILFLSHLSSPRINHDSELVLWNEPFARIKCEVEKSYSESLLEIIINPPKPKILKVNGIKKNKSSLFLGNIVAVSFSVDDLSILRGAPSDRRKWLDNAIVQLYPMYSERLSTFNKIRVQRNNLLKTLQATPSSIGSFSDTLSVWNEQLAITGSNIIHLRLKFLTEIQKQAKIKHEIISKGKENLNLKYNSNIFGSFDFQEGKILSPDQIAVKFKELLEVRKNDEILRAQTLVGPHRDDLELYINGIDALKFASQGQQRTVVLSLKLSELDFIKKIISETPILLLDDVLAELDKTRQNYLLESIGNDIQFVITTTDINNFDQPFLKDVMVYNIDAGTITDNS